MSFSGIHLQILFLLTLHRSTGPCEFVILSLALPCYVITASLFCMEGCEFGPYAMIPARDNQLLRQCLGDNGNIELEKAEGNVIGNIPTLWNQPLRGRLKREYTFPYS